MNAAPDPVGEALAIAARGWPVIPLHTSSEGRCSCGSYPCGKDNRNSGKHPRITGWQEQATTDPDRIRGWARDFGACNWGLLTGARSGVDVLDVDPRNGGQESLDQLEADHGKLPDTPVSLTGGGGLHLLLRHAPGHCIASRANVLGQGLDIKADGGFVVAPGSIHASGRPYVWNVEAHPDDLPLADWPEPILKRINGRSAASLPVARATSEAGKIECPRDGVSRHDTLWNYAVRWAKAGLGEIEVRTFVFGLAGEWGMRPDRDGELENIVGGAMLRAKPGATVETRTVDFLDLHAIYTQPLPPIPWQVEGYLARGEFLKIAGEWGSGKSLSAEDLALSLALGSPWMGFIPIVGGPYRCLYLDEENNRGLAERRLRQLMKGRSLSQDAVREVPLYYVTRGGVTLDDPTWHDWLRRQIDERQATHLFLDSLIRFARIEENSNSEMSAFFGNCIQPLINEYTLSVVALDHLGKPSKERTDPGHRVRGASDKAAACDEMICMEGERGQATRSITHEKTRWNRYQPAIVSTCTESDDEEAVWITAAWEVPDTQDTVFRLIRDSGKTGILRKRIVEELAKINAKGADRYASRALKTLKKQGSTRFRAEGKEVRYWTDADAPTAAE